jgi:hypothetical protein
VDPLEAVFVFCFVFGLATSVLSFLMGTLHGIDGNHALLGGHGGPTGADVGGHLGGGTTSAHGGALAHGDAAAHHAAADAPSTQISPFNLQTITVFLTFFGGVGWVLYDWLGLAPALALIAGVVAGVAGGAVVFWFLVKVLLAGQRFMDPASSQMEGVVGSVTHTIGTTGTGEIVFSRDGSRHSAGARSATGLAIPVGTEVVIVRYEQGLAYVEPWSSFAGEE